MPPLQVQLGEGGDNMIDLPEWLVYLRQVKQEKVCAACGAAGWLMLCAGGGYA